MKILSTPSPHEPRRDANPRVASLRLFTKAICLGLTAMLAALGTGPVVAQVGVGPLALAPPPAVPAPQDRAFGGTVGLAVDATDTGHQVFSVHETIPVQASGDVVLLYPQWETGSHAPTVSVAELAGLVVQVDGQRLEWHRDPVDPPDPAHRGNVEAGTPGPACRHAG
ncbi:MAG: hypothetical protein ABI247_06000 [Rhodanobacter sp.]